MSSRPKLKILEPKVLEPKVLDHGVSLPDTAPSSMETVMRSLKRPKKRLKLFELEHWLMCSIVGTCLGPPDLDRVVKRHRLRFGDDVREHHLHSYFVEQAASDWPVGRTMNKILDEKFSRAIKLVGQETDEAGLRALWEEFCAKGHVAAGYWAFMCHSHTPISPRNDIFGDVPMLSHFMGGHNRQNAKALRQAEQRAEQLSSRLSKARQHAQETIADRDQRIGELESELQERREQLTSTYAHMTRSATLSHAKRSDPRRSDRRLSAACWRCRP